MTETERKAKSEELRRKTLGKMEREDDVLQDVCAKCGVSYHILHNFLGGETYHRLTLQQRIKINDYLNQ